jgi:hypothetical protein
MQLRHRKCIACLIHPGGQTACGIAAEIRFALIRVRKVNAINARVTGAQLQAERDRHARRILVVGDDLHVGQAISIWIKQDSFWLAVRRGAMCCRRKPFKRMEWTILPAARAAGEAERSPFHDRGTASAEAVPWEVS